MILRPLTLVGILALTACGARVSPGSDAGSEAGAAREAGTTDWPRAECRSGPTDEGNAVDDPTDPPDACVGVPFVPTVTVFASGRTIRELSGLGSCAHIPAHRQLRSSQRRCRPTQDLLLGRRASAFRRRSAPNSNGRGNRDRPSPTGPASTPTRAALSLACSRPQWVAPRQRKVCSVVQDAPRAVRVTRVGAAPNAIRSACA